MIMYDNNYISDVIDVVSLLYRLFIYEVNMYHIQNENSAYIDVHGLSNRIIFNKANNMKTYFFMVRQARMEQTIIMALILYYF